MTHAPRSCDPSCYRHGCDPPPSELTVTPIHVPSSLLSLDVSAGGFVPACQATLPAYWSKIESFVTGHSTITAGSLAERVTSSEPPRDRSTWLFALRCWLGAIGCSLLIGLAGCGPASSDNAPNLESRARVGLSGTKGMGQGGKTGVSPISTGTEPDSASGKESVPEGGNIDQGDKLTKPTDMANIETDGRDKLPVPGIPESIAKGLDSLDVRDRIQALDHWEKKGTNPPLDPVFEAMEDENDAVRAKATAIIEQRWTIERERERG